MAPALEMALLWLLFAGTHVGLGIRPVRTPLVARLGEFGFSLVFSAVAAATFTALVTFYASHRFEGAPGPDLGSVPVLRWMLIGAVVVGVVLAVAGVHVFPSSPMALFRDRSAPAPRGLERITRHPFFAGAALLGIAHALLATRLVGTVAFSGLALLAGAGSWHQDRKLAKQRGPAYVDYCAATSAVPFAAILGGRQRLALRELPLGALAAGLAAAFLLRARHATLLSNGGAWVIGATVGGAAVLTIVSWWRARNARAKTGAPEGSAGLFSGLVSRRRALAAAGATLLAYVGMVHEVVGDRLYPDGPALFGGILCWHAAGLSLTAIGIVTLAGTLGLARVPVVLLAIVAIVVGALAVAGDALLHGGFHFFAFTMVVAGALVVATMRREHTTSAARAR
jgi:uncharacterized membrane protein